jgi:hypothetical protein
MASITFIRENNYLIKVRPLKVFIDNEFIDYLEPNEKVKTIEVNDQSTNLSIKVNNNSSNNITLNKSILNGSTKIKVTSQIQNGLLLFIYACFFGGLVLNMLGYISSYLGLALITPMLIIVYWQTFGRKNYLRLSKTSE